MVNGETNALNRVNHVEGFNPMDFAREIVNGQGEKSLYLDVKYRIAWFRMLYPNGRISKHIASITDNMAVVEARIYKDTTDAEDAYLANGFGQRSCDQTNQYGARFLETAETGSVGRALAAAGFNIAGGIEADGSDDGSSPVDTPFTVSATGNTGPNSTESNNHIQQDVTHIQTPKTALQPAPPTVDDIMTTMTIEQAKAYTVTFKNGKHAGKTLGQVALDSITDLEWIAYRCSTKDNVMIAAARLLLEAGKQMAG